MAKRYQISLKIFFKYASMYVSIEDGDQLKLS
jgi:hypothetical protein